jgi:glycosyltransferase involved in cell wall biosynthesis
MEGIAKHTPLRILMTTDTVGGVWTYAVTLCRALQPFHVQVHLVTAGAPVQPAQKSEAECLENVTLYETDFKLEWMEAPWESIDAGAAWLLQLEKEIKPHLIHLNGYVYGGLPWQAPVVVVAHSDVFSWWQAVKGEAPPAAWQEYHQRVRNGLQKADYLIAPSRSMLHSIQDLYNVATPAAVIYNGRSSETFYPGNKKPYAFSMGRLWDEAKNIRLLAEAAPLFQNRMLIAGGNSFEKQDYNTAATNITYLGKLSEAEVGAQLAAASVYVLPAKYEPFGLSVLEAALSGCALVLGNISSLKELWKDSAVYVDTDDAIALAQTINHLMQNETVRQQYAQKALKQAGAYTTTAMAAAYLQLYRQLLAQTNAVQKEIV